MKQLIKDYTFDASAKTITFQSLLSLNIEQILVITNITRGTVIYLPQVAEKRGTLSNNVLTLNYNTTEMDDSDFLQIFIDVLASGIILDNNDTIGKQFSCHTGKDAIKIHDNNPRSSLIAIRPKIKVNNVTNIVSINILGTEFFSAARNILYELVFIAKGYLSGSQTWLATTSLYTEYTKSSLTFTNEILISSGFSAYGTSKNNNGKKKNNLGYFDNLRNEYSLTSDGTNADVIAILITAVGGDTDMWGSIDWNELR